MDDGQVRRPTRLALVGLPGLVADILTVLVDSWGDFEICARLAYSDDLLTSLVTSSADVLICALPEPLAVAAWSGVVRTAARPALVNLVDGERSATAYYLRPDLSEFNDLDAASLRSALEVCRSAGTDR